MFKKLNNHMDDESYLLCNSKNALKIIPDLTKNLRSEKILRNETLNVFSMSCNIEKTHDYINVTQVLDDIDFNYRINDARPYIKILIGNTVCTALLDTGASISVLGKDSENIWKKFSHFNVDKSINVRVANG